jgi:hypothetical protein
MTRVLHEPDIYEYPVLCLILVSRNCEQIIMCC